MTDADSPVLDLLDRLSIELVAITNRAIAEGGMHDLSFAQWRLLAALGDAPRALRLKEVAEQVSASMPSASRLVQRMERRGFVSSARAPSDGRGREIALTAKGEAVRTGVVGRRRALIAVGIGELAGAAIVHPDLVTIVERLARRT